MHVIHIPFPMQNTFTFLNHGAFGAVLKEALHASLVSRSITICSTYCMFRFYMLQLVNDQSMKLNFLYNFSLSPKLINLYLPTQNSCK